MSAGGEGTVGAGTSESASAGCSLSERVRPSSSAIIRRTVPDLDGLAVFTWGRGEDGQLGLGDTSDQDEPTYVDALRGVGVLQIACGSGHTVVLTTDGEVYTWVSWQSASGNVIHSSIELRNVWLRRDAEMMAVWVMAITDGNISPVSPRAWLARLWCR